MAYSSNTAKGIGNFFNVPLKVNVTTFKGEISLPGWAVSDFTRTGKLGLWNILKILEVVRMIEFKYQDFQSLNASADGGLTCVVTAQTVTCCPELYSMAKMNCPMKVNIRYGYIGRTSFSVIIEIYYEGTRSVVLRNERQLVFIDTKLRKSVPVPEYLEKFRESHPRTGFTVNVPTKPAGKTKVYSFETKVLASDMDLLYHTNQSTYYKFSLDAAYEASKSGFLKNFSGDICDYEPRNVQAKYAGETFAGDMLTVDVWEDEFNKSMLHFEITKKLSPVFHMTLEFHSSRASRL